MKVRGEQNKLYLVAEHRKTRRKKKKLDSSFFSAPAGSSEANNSKLFQYTVRLQGLKILVFPSPSINEYKIRFHMFGYRSRCNAMVVGANVSTCLTVTITIVRTSSNEPHDGL